MKRVSIVLLWMIVLTSISGLINHNSSEYYQYQSNLPTQEERDGSLVTLSDGDEGGMPGLELDCCTDEEWYSLITLGVVFFGIPSFLIFRIIWKLIKKFFFSKSGEDGVEKEVGEGSKSLGSHLPVTEKELFEFRVKEIKKRRRREEKEGEEINPFNFKEEFVILSVFVSIASILIFGFDIFSSH